MEIIADSIGVSRQWILNCYITLEAKGLIVRRRNWAKDTAVRTTDEWNEWHSPCFEKYLLYLKSSTIEVMTGDVQSLKSLVMKKFNQVEAAEKFKNVDVNKVDIEESACKQTLHPDVNKVDIACKQTLHNTNINLKETNIINNKPQEFNSEYFDLSETLLTEIRKNLPTFKTPIHISKWAAEVDKMVRLDSRTVREIEFLIKWSQQDDFWKANILSMGKLREKFDQLMIKAQSDWDKRQARKINSY
jgi:hypothetical protein